MPNPVRLNHRAIVSVTGDDADAFLGGLITNSVARTGDGGTRYAALLTPQGKVIADFLVFQSADGFVFDCARCVADDLVKRLTMFKLRSKVTIAVRDELCAIAFAGEADPRNAEGPHRMVAPGYEGPAEGSLDEYHTRRIAAALPEQSLDFESNEVFPADINMDAHGGVDFAKGCFVGQEVVSRMKRRGTARRRTLVFRSGDGAPLTPAPLMADDFEIGQLTSSSGGLGLGRVRIDRLSEAEADGIPVTAAGIVCRWTWPEWLARPAKPSGEAGVD